MLRYFAILLAIGSPAAEYVGSEACAACHADIYRSFSRTPMARSGGVAGRGGERFDSTAFQDSRGTYSYAVGREGGSYYFDFRQQGAKQPIEGRRELAYSIGSGTAARSYLFTVDGFLYEAPVAYYSRSASWKAAPGYESYDYPYLTRPVLAGCLGCHTSGIQHVSGTQNRYATPPFREGVSCERCHGPGSDHIQSGKPMLNPARLTPPERDSICAQCHLSGEIRIPKPGKDEVSFRPGGRLADTLTVFVRSGSPSQMRVTSHVENLAQSACKRASGDKLWCGTCHDPHTVPAAAEKVAYFRSKCLTCHQVSDCRATQSSRQANGDDCIACHMPRNPPADVEHVVFTDHSIRKRPVASEAPAEDAELVPFGGGQPSLRDLALAYATLGLREDNTIYRNRGFRLLQQAAARGEADAEALAYLAEFYRDAKDDAHALPAYEQSWRMDPSQPAVLAALGAYEMQAKSVDAAIRFWNQALAISPALVLTRVNLAAALVAKGRNAEARAVLEKALEFNPASAEARELLSRLGK